MFDPNIPRWFKASVAKHISDRVPDYPLYLNTYRGNDTVWGELRLDGPVFEETELQSYKIELTVNILVTVFCGQDDYLIDRVNGLFGTTLNDDICCYKFGTGIQDDGTQFTVLQPWPNNERKVDIMNFGLISAESKFKRSCLESSYVAFL